VRNDRLGLSVEEVTNTLSSSQLAMPNRKFIACFALFVVNLLGYGPATEADQYVSKDAFVRRNIPTGSTIIKRTVELGFEDKKRIKRKWLLSWLPDSLDFLVGRCEDGRMSGVVSFAVVYGEIHREYHHVGVGIAPSGTIAEVAVMDAKSERPGRLATKGFLEQFKGKGRGRLSLAKDIDAVSGATESSNTVVDAVNAVMAIYSEFVTKEGDLSNHMTHSDL
jgi:hypothetical protein